MKTREQNRIVKQTEKNVIWLVYPTDRPRHVAFDWLSERKHCDFTGEKCLRMLWKKWHVIYFGQCHWLRGKNSWDERCDGSFFWQWQRCNFLLYFGQSFDVSVFSREYSVLKLAKNRIGMVWFSVIDVEIAGLHVEDMPKRWVIFALFVSYMFRATRYKKKL